MRILLVEDDPMIGEAVRAGFRREGFSVDWVKDGRAAELAATTEPFDLVLLDLGLPKKDGLEVLRAVRAKGIDVPVLIVTARDALAERVAGLDAGADDYILKPFDLLELAARVRAVARRRQGRADPLLRHRGLVINPATREAAFNGAPVSFSAKEYALLETLLAHPGVVLSRAQIEERLYGWGEEIESNAVEVHIHSLRRKLGSDFIRNIRGVGYLAPRE
jgi:two-component system response regulator QseB